MGCLLNLQALLAGEDGSVRWLAAMPGAWSICHRAQRRQAYLAPVSADAA